MQTGSTQVTTYNQDSQEGSLKKQPTGAENLTNGEKKCKIGEENNQKQQQVTGKNVGKAQIIGTNQQNHCDSERKSPVKVDISLKFKGAILRKVLENMILTSNKDSKRYFIHSIERYLKSFSFISNSHDLSELQRKIRNFKIQIMVILLEKKTKSFFTDFFSALQAKTL